MKAKTINETLKSINLSQDHNDFIDYVCSFYAYDGPEGKGFFSGNFNDKLSCEMVKDAYIKWLKKYPNSPIDTREEFKAWLWEIYPEIVEGPSEYTYKNAIRRNKKA